ncbi:hypothetical protein HPB51_014924 [Rhipicephalus microplus]|uniref:Uncharacterized protein n=1 Tax=Rhipicephalus microplus TaxID=6941 RepID=A0A9J6EGM3_RHIMP|nr:hypothetical protein HPB51_014924 [Rhipicephalus microplus]
MPWSPHLVQLLALAVALALTGQVARASDNHALLDRLQEVLDNPASRIGALCRNDTLFYLDRLRNGSPWALKSKCLPRSLLAKSRSANFEGASGLGAECRSQGLRPTLRAARRRKAILSRCNLRCHVAASADELLLYGDAYCASIDRGL